MDSDSKLKNIMKLFKFENLCLLEESTGHVNIILFDVINIEYLYT